MESGICKRIALEALSGRWKIACLTTFVASLLGGTIMVTGVGGVGGGGGGGSSSSSSGVSSSYMVTGGGAGGGSSSSSAIVSYSYGDYESLIAVLVVVSGILSILALVSIILGGATKYGYAKFLFKLLNKEEVAVSDLFSEYSRIGSGFVMNLLTGIYLVLWTLLFFPVGIVKSFSYALTPYIMAENPNVGANEAITMSREMMNGNKGKLFFLKLSFIGWTFLLGLLAIVLLFPVAVAVVASEVLGVVALLAYFLILTAAGMYLITYMETAGAAFYIGVSRGVTNNVYSNDYNNDYI